MILELLQTGLLLDKLLFWIVVFGLIAIAPKIWSFIKNIAFDCIAIYTAIQQAKVDVTRMNNNADYLEEKRKAELAMWQETKKMLIDSNKLRLRAGLPDFIPDKYDIELGEEKR